MSERGTPAERRQEVLDSIFAIAAGRMPPAATRVDYASLAETLNRAGIRTMTGRRWMPDNLRMFLRATLEP